MSKNILFLIPLLLLAACSEGPYKDYIGYWTLTKKGSPTTNFFEIKTSNNNYIIDQNELGRLGPQGGNEDIVFSERDGTLILFNPFPTTLSNNKNELIITGIGTATRLTNAEFEELTTAETEQIANKQVCKELKQKFQKESPPHSFDFKLGLTEKEKSAREQARANKEKIRDKYVVLAKEAGLTNCRIR